MMGAKPKWNPDQRPLATSAWAEIYPRLWATMADARMPMTRNDHQEMITYYRLAFVNMKQGTASDETWSCLALGANMALVLAEKGYGHEWIPLIKEAQEALIRANIRGGHLGTWRMDGPGLAAMGDVLDILDSQLEIATRGEIVQARDDILERMIMQAQEQQKLDEQDAESKLSEYPVGN